MRLEPETCYRALMARDARFDGCFFVGVTSTGVYCRPVCRVKTPQRKNCNFFATAAAAEAAGYRPCLRCRPELAPGTALLDRGERLAAHAASRIEEGALNELSLDGLASELGVTSRHLRRVFQSEFGVSPVAFAQTQRLLTAKRLLTDTGLPITEIAFASGFKSLRRFDALFKQRYRLNPLQIRKLPVPSTAREVLTFRLHYRPPYDWNGLLGFLGPRSISGVEWVGGSAYRRIVRLRHGGRILGGWIEITCEAGRHAMRVDASGSLVGAVPALLSRVKHLLDLTCNPVEVDEGLGPVAVRSPGIRVPGAMDGFEIAVRAILGQQVSVAAARTLAGRVAAAFGPQIESPFEALTRAFPFADEVAGLNTGDLAPLGILPTRAQTILALATEIAEGRISLRPGVNVDSTIEKLNSIAGIGPWTSQYIAMRALAWPDAFPHSDLGVMRAMGERSARRVLAAAERWRPWRAYAAMHLWARSGIKYGIAL